MKDNVSEIDVQSLLSDVKTPAASQRALSRHSVQKSQVVKTPIDSERSLSLHSSQLLARSPQSVKYMKDQHYQEQLPVNTQDFYDIKKTLGIGEHATEKEIMKSELKVKHRLSETLAKQSDTKFLQRSCLPPIPKHAPAPHIAQIGEGKKAFIASNDSHSKSTNNGFSRNSLGGFFAH